MEKTFEFQIAHKHINVTRQYNTERPTFQKYLLKYHSVQHCPWCTGGCDV